MSKILLRSIFDNSLCAKNHNKIKVLILVLGLRTISLFGSTVYVMQRGTLIPKQLAINSVV